MSSFRKFHSIAALCGDGLRPELQALFERLAVDPNSELFVRSDGMVQSGPDPISVQTRSVQKPGEVESPNPDGAPPPQAGRVQLERIRILVSPFRARISASHDTQRSAAPSASADEI
jgi:hypothetical protein